MSTVQPLLRSIYICNKAGIKKSHDINPCMQNLGLLDRPKESIYLLSCCLTTFGRVEEGKSTEHISLLCFETTMISSGFEYEVPGYCTKSSDNKAEIVRQRLDEQHPDLAMSRHVKISDFHANGA